jgi:hypothetical protein
MTDNKKYFEWKKTVYKMSNYSFKELESSIKSWMIEEGLWSNDLEISVISRTQESWNKNFNIKYKINNQEETYEIMSDKLRLSNNEE